MHYIDSAHDLLEVVEGIGLGQKMAAFQYILQRTAVALLVDELDVVRSFKHLVEFDDVFMLELFQSLNLIDYELLELLGLDELGELENLYCKEVVGCDVAALLDLAELASADRL